MVPSIAAIGKLLWAHRAFIGLFPRMLALMGFQILTVGVEFRAINRIQSVQMRHQRVGNSEILCDRIYQLIAIILFPNLICVVLRRNLGHLQILRISQYCLVSVDNIQ
jgi:hypothetical protein